MTDGQKHQQRSGIRRLVALGVVILLLIWAIICLHEVHVVLNDLESRNQMAAVRVAFSSYMKEHHKLPPVYDGGGVPGQMILWKESLRKYMPPAAIALQKLPVFAIIHKNSVWIQRPQEEEMHAKYARQIIFIYLPQVRPVAPSVIRVAEKGPRILGATNNNIDFSRAFVLRMDGSIEMVPQGLSAHDIIQYLLSEFDPHSI